MDSGSVGVVCAVVERSRNTQRALAVHASAPYHRTVPTSTREQSGVEDASRVVESFVGDGNFSMPGMKGFISSATRRKKEQVNEGKLDFSTLSWPEKGDARGDDEMRKEGIRLLIRTRGINVTNTFAGCRLKDLTRGDFLVESLFCFTSNERENDEEADTK